MTRKNQPYQEQTSKKGQDVENDQDVLVIEEMNFFWRTDSMPKPLLVSNALAAPEPSRDNLPLRTWGELRYTKVEHQGADISCFCL